MSPGATFERVYYALKAQLGSGRHAPGEHLEPAALSLDLNASITPVRDALHRLVGEGLVEAPRGDGFRAPPVTEVGLRHLYRWNASLLGLATRSLGGHVPVRVSAASTADGWLERTERLFAAIAARSGNPGHMAAIARLNDRLRPIRCAELDLIHRREEEVAEMSDRLAGGEAVALRRSIAAYHRRRERLAAEIVAALQPPR